MPDYDKIIEHLWEAVCVPHYDNAGNAWEYPKEVQDAANAAIEAIDSLTTPRVMTEGDVLHSIGNPLWFESRGRYLGQIGFWCLLFEVDPELHVRIVQSVTGGKITLSLIDYGKTWRCWTAKPTDGQRKAVKWDE